ncbi:hypothetical protein DL769_007112 [Monosporascus sp. CRB-8-3]|nr:hypothetical protein DL769_007112 [Monosporascus sp. CRB-8-3]
MSAPSTAQPQSPQPPTTTMERLAHRIHNTTGKERLPQICIGGFALELAWHTQVERRIFSTPLPAVRRAMLRAAVFWPSLFVVTELALKWAEKGVAMYEGEQTRRPEGSGMDK